MTQRRFHPHDAGPIDHASLDGETRALWERHGVCTDGEECVGYVTVLAVTGHYDDGREYRRFDQVTAPGVTYGEAREMLDEGIDLLATGLPERVPAPRRHSGSH
jgi:hypothetical protein